MWKWFQEIHGAIDSEINEDGEVYLRSFQMESDLEEPENDTDE